MKSIIFAFVSLLAASRVDAVILASEAFDTGANNWSGRDSTMTFGYSSGVGNPAGSLQGTFAAQGSPSFQLDAFRATSSSSGGAFAGNLYLNYTNFSNVRFSFLAADVLPSTFIFRVGDGTHTFFYNITPQLSTASVWTTVDIPLIYSGSWIGGTASQFTNVFNGVSFMDVQVARNGTGAQNYFLDNFSLLGSSASVPEPNSLLLIFAGGVIFRYSRSRNRARALMGLHAAR